MRWWSNWFFRFLLGFGLEVVVRIVEEGDMGEVVFYFVVSFLVYFISRFWRGSRDGGRELGFRIR